MKASILAWAAAAILLAAPLASPVVLVSQQVTTMAAGNSQTIDGQNTTYNITIANITESYAVVSIDGKEKPIYNDTMITEDGGRLSISLVSLAYGIVSKVTLMINVSCVPECGNLECGASPNMCGTCGSCGEGTQECIEGYCFGTAGAYSLHRDESVRLNVSGEHYLITLQTLAGVIAKLEVNGQVFDVFSNSPESMDISKDGLEIVVVSMHYDDNNTPDSTLTFESRSPVAGCTPNCSCAAGTCAGLTCWDQCGGTCEGNLTPDCSGRECGMSPNGCGSCDDPGCPFHMRCSDGQCVLWECMPYIMVIIALIAVIAAVTFIAIKRKPYRTPSSIGGVSLT